MVRALRKETAVNPTIRTLLLPLAVLAAVAIWSQRLAPPLDEPALEITTMIPGSEAFVKAYDI